MSKRARGKQAQHNHRPDDDESRQIFQVQIKAATLVATAASIYLWMDRLLLGLMRYDAIQMAHLDPTDIISQPVPIDVTKSFIFSTTFTTIIISFIGYVVIALSRNGDVNMPQQSLLSNLLRSVIAVLLGIPIFGVFIFAAAVLCGASPWVDTKHTFLACLYVSTLACGSSLLYDAKDYLDMKSSATALVRLLFCGNDSGSDGGCNRIISPREPIDSCAMYGTFVGLVPAMILRLLDHGVQSQRWPFPMLVGSSIGYCIGSLLGTISVYSEKKQQSKKVYDKL